MRILFLCTGNSCRSQMAQGWADALLPDEIETCSAGIEAHGLNPHAVQVMAETGVDISRYVSKTIDQLPRQDFDHVITLCSDADARCPTFSHCPCITHVGFDDPPRLAAAETDPQKALDHYRRVRDQIMVFIQSLPQFLTSPHND